MGLNIDTLKMKEKETTLYYGAEYGDPIPINITYRPEILELGEYDQMVGSQEVVLSPSTIAYMKKVIVKWDIENKDGVIPIDETGIPTLGQKLSQWLITELFKDSRPNLQKQQPSNNGSSKGKR